LIGGGGEKVTLKLTAMYADIWNGFGPAETFKHKNSVLDGWCREIGRDPGSIERSISIPASSLDSLDDIVAAGANHIIMQLADPWDFSSVERLVRWHEQHKR
jgi:alkanesulfonate monooxygenase SsuD/methylene tetrahydromethanopterin reductase-like flavin-dependent oxidoreductase (luciferase family)